MPATNYAPGIGVTTGGAVLPTNTTIRNYASRKAHDAVVAVAVGAAAGTTATATRAQVVGNGGVTSKGQHGKVDIATVSDINRATTAQDVADLKSELTARNNNSFVFPKDLSGNGGPAFTRTY